MARSQALELMGDGPGGDRRENATLASRSGSKLQTPTCTACPRHVPLPSWGSPSPRSRPRRPRAPPRPQASPPARSSRSRRRPATPAPPMTPGTRRSPPAPSCAAPATKCRCASPSNSAPPARAPGAASSRKSAISAPGPPASPAPMACGTRRPSTASHKAPSTASSSTPAASAKRQGRHPHQPSHHHLHPAADQRPPAPCSASRSPSSPPADAPHHHPQHRSRDQRTTGRHGPRHRHPGHPRHRHRRRTPGTRHHRRPVSLSTCDATVNVTVQEEGEALTDIAARPDRHLPMQDGGNPEGTLTRRADRAKPPAAHAATLSGRPADEAPTGPGYRN